MSVVTQLSITIDGDRVNLVWRCLALIVFVLACPALAGTIHEGKVVKIVDGDTLTILVGKRQLKIRLSDIDTLEGALKK